MELEHKYCLECGIEFNFLAKWQSKRKFCSNRCRNRNSARNFYKNNKVSCNLKRKKWNDDHKAYASLYKRAYVVKFRNEILTLLGNTCVNCGFSDKQALQIDHIHGRGCKQRAIFGTSCTYYKKILDEIKMGSKEYQILCANCNWIKKVENEEKKRIKYQNEENM